MYPEGQWRDILRELLNAAFCATLRESSVLVLAITKRLIRGTSVQLNLRTDLETKRNQHSEHLKIEERRYSILAVFEIWRLFV